jgi:hypothetical protein
MVCHTTNCCRHSIHCILTATKYWHFCELTYVLTTALIKLAIAALLLRIAIVPWHTRALKILIIVVCAFGFFTFFSGAFQCWPISELWLLEEDGFCFSGMQIALLSYTHSTTSAVADWFCGTLPFFMVRKSNMPRGMKTTVVAILGIGSMYVMTILTLPEAAPGWC